MLDLTVTRQLLIQLLSNSSSPELGARLKQRLNAAFIANGLGPFDEKSFGYHRFKDFLSRGNEDILTVERQAQSEGDIIVSLKANISAGGPPVTATARAPLEPHPVVRNDVWQAFLNPDPARRRYLNKKTLLTTHFLTEAPEAANLEVEASPEDFVEIEPISADSQAGLMREFLDSLRLSPAEKASLEALANAPYSSGVNTIFTRALGSNGNAWRIFRTKQVLKRITAWCDQHFVSFDGLCVQPRVGLIASGLAAPTTIATLSPRQQVEKLLDLLEDEDISRLIIPTLLSILLVKSHL
ncbi:MAG: hypothetical protein WC934_12055 [Acidithiobacillus sp.]|jgi:hypothetical protein|uniref:hypothetical protein n=1 Tax=Acidithiobacillus sp. TaxID=1872118 RepID=UPI00355FBBCE